MEVFLDFPYMILIRLAAAVLCGGLIGLERGGSNHEAGLRTHIIVCLGSASVASLSELIVLDYTIPAELMRMSAQVISGVGFLGAGCIIKDGNRIRGITTAAGLWTTACIGLVVGAGYYILGFSIVGFMLLTMLGLRTLANSLSRRKYRFTALIHFEIQNLKALLSALLSLKMQFNIQGLQSAEDAESILKVRFILGKRHSVEDLLCTLTAMPEVKGINS